MGVSLFLMKELYNAKSHISVLSILFLAGLTEIGGLLLTISLEMIYFVRIDLHTVFLTTSRYSVKNHDAKELQALSHFNIIIFIKFIIKASQNYLNISPHQDHRYSLNKHIN
jgi:hypothetical protein